MEDQLIEAIDAQREAGGEFALQINRLRDFRRRMLSAGVVGKSEQFTQPRARPIEPRRSIFVSP